jgi:hypothetical protein
MDELARREKDLYEPIQKLMELRGYAVICQFKTFSPLTRRKRILDLLGFRWMEDGDLDASAIEAKQGASPADTLAALGQSIEYQLYVPRVSVAAEVPREDLAFAENPLRQLGLGYIHAMPTSATEIIAPAFSPRCYQNEFNQVTRHAGILCLIGRNRWQEDCRREHHSGGDKGTEAAGYPFYCIHTTDPVQYSMSADGASRKVYLEIWTDRKPVWTRIYRDVEASRLALLLADSDATTTLSIFRRDTFGSLGNRVEQQQLQHDQAALSKGLDYARERLKEDRIIPVVSIAARLWDWDAMPRRDEAEKAVAQAIERLDPIKGYLASMAK